MTHNAEAVRRAEARRRLVEALAGTVNDLSNVLYDGACDGQTWPDGEGGFATFEHGYDSDDLAAVLWGILQAARNDGGDDRD